MNVLILTDFSKVAENAGKYAVHFLGKVPASFYLLNIETFNFRGIPLDLINEKKDKAQDSLKTSLEYLQKETPNKEHKFQAHFSEDNLVTATRKFVEEKKIDLIVMGAAGKEYPQNAILGNHTYEIIRKIKCNILAVSQDSIYSHPEKLVLPIDYSVTLQDKIFQFFEKPGIIESPHLTVMEIGDHSAALHAIEVPRQIVAGQFKVDDIRFLEMEESAIYDEALLMELQKKFDMIVILGKNLSICDRLLHSRYGICTAICNKLPILVLHG